MFIASNGEKYQGEYKDGLKSGKGIYVRIISLCFQTDSRIPRTQDWLFRTIHHLCSRDCPDSLMVGSSCERKVVVVLKCS